MAVMYQRIWIACVLLTLLAFGAAGCGLFVEPAADAPVEHGNTVVALYATGSVEDDVLTVRGTATVPDGALLAYEVGDPMLDASGDEDAFVIGEAVVTGEEFAFEVPVEGWPDESVNVWVAFQTLLGDEAEQPAEVVELYGEMGENMKGDVTSTQTAEGLLRWVETEFRVAR